jgi:hypothetical protein
MRDIRFCRKLEAARHAAIADGRSVAIVKHLRTDEWEMIEGHTVLVPDVVVKRDGRILAFTVSGRRALAQAS